MTYLCSQVWPPFLGGISEMCPMPWLKVFHNSNPLVSWRGMSAHYSSRTRDSSPHLYDTLQATRTIVTTFQHNHITR